MGNRSFLYIRTGSDIVSCGEASNNVPTMWQVMLADAVEEEPIRYQRIFDDLDTQNLATSLTAAVERGLRVLDFVIAHPAGQRLRALVPAISRLREHLLNMLDEYDGNTVISADFDELAWMEENGSDGFTAKLREYFAWLWQEVDMAILDGDYEAFDAVIAESGAPGDWSKEWDWWRYHFGLDSFGLEFDDTSVQEMMSVETEVAKEGHADDTGAPSAAAVSTPTSLFFARLTLSVIFVLIFGAVWWLLRNSGSWQYIPVAVCAWLLKATWLSNVEPT